MWKLCMQRRASGPDCVVSRLAKRKLCCCELELAMGGHLGCSAGPVGRDVAPIMAPAAAHVAQAIHYDRVLKKVASVIADGGV